MKILFPPKYHTTNNTDESVSTLKYKITSFFTVFNNNFTFKLIHRPLIVFSIFGITKIEG